MAWIKVTPAAGLLLLCFLWSLASLRPDLFPNLLPNLLPPLESQALPFALLGLSAALFSFVRGAGWPQPRQIRSAVLIGLGLFVAPAVAFYLSKEYVSDLTVVALFSLTPVFAVVLEPHIGRGVAPEPRGGLLAALAAVVGTLYVIPAGAPNSIRSGSAFCAVILAAACVAATNCLAVTVAAESTKQSFAPLAAIAATTAVAGLGVLSALTEVSVWQWHELAPELAWSAAAEFPGLLLLFWLMRRMSAARMTTRFVLTPLMASLIGLVLLRPTVELRAAVGLLLMAAGSGWLLFAPQDNPETGTSPLRLDGQ